MWLLKNITYIDRFYGYFTHFPFIFISAAGRELSRKFLTNVWGAKSISWLHFSIASTIWAIRGVKEKGGHCRNNIYEKKLVLILFLILYNMTMQ